MFLFIFIVFGPVFLGLARSVGEYKSLGGQKPLIFTGASFKNRKNIDFPLVFCKVCKMCIIHCVFDSCVGHTF